MKIVTCELHKVALAALVLGIFSVNPNAHAVQIGNWKIERHPAGAAPSAASIVGDAGSLDVAGAKPTPMVDSAPMPTGQAPAAPAAVSAMATPNDGLIAAPRAQDADGFIRATANDSGGMSLARLRGMSGQNDFKVKLEGDVLQVTGTMPLKCAVGARISVASVAASEGVSAHHELTVIPGAGCDKLTPAEQQDLVSLASPRLFGNGKALSDNTIDGDICVVHSENGLKSCDKIEGLSYVSQLTKKKASDAKAAADARAFRANQDAALVKKLDVMCRKGDFVGFGKEIEAQKAFLGDVTDILSKVDGLKQKYFADQIMKAKDIDSMKDAYQAYLDASEEGGWDTDEVTAKYADKRVEKMNEIVKDSSLSASDRASAIRDLASDLRDMDLYDKDHKGRIGAAYMDLGNSLKDSGSTDDVSKYDEAARYYNEALQFANPEQKVAIDVQIEKMYAEAANQCLADAKDPAKGSKLMGQCQKLAEKAKKEMDVAIRAQGQVHNDGSLAALAAMKNEKIARFGQDGMVYNQSINGYDGSSVNVNLRGGSWDANVYQTYQQSQSQFLMQMMQGGMQRSPSGTSGGSIF